ncbi:MAG: 2-dehydro-3-deoxygalactonokinase [Trueperaceae bacterium]|nr:2-dehydro-3-deoxygalactonokinase [Trueperaceae bacterium]
MEHFIVVDSGTSTTRARLYTGGRVTRTETEPVGARNTATEGSNAALKAGLATLLSRLQASEEARGTDVEAVICSGMITSNMGLLEVPHLTAPASVDALAEGVVRQDFPDVTPLPVHFVRGVKTVADRLDACDVLRGEEVECLGLRELLALSGPAVFMHHGSHSKSIQTDAEGTILQSRTAITGELLAAIVQHTILANSVVGFEALELDQAQWREGLETARESGVGRALFLVRVGEQIAGRTKMAMTSFLLGVLASMDLPLLDEGLQTDATLVLYGRGVQKVALGRYLEEQAPGRVIVTDDERAELSAVVGAVRIYERHLELTAGRNGGTS